MTLNPKRKVFDEFFVISVCDRHLREIAPRWLEIDQDNLRRETAKAVARLMSFAQITCGC